MTCNLTPPADGEGRSLDFRGLRIAMVTETYPPEVNGVANTVCRVVMGLRGRGHAVQLIRPRQPAVDTGTSEGDGETVLTGGVALPMYGHLRMGLPHHRLLRALWRQQRPDVVHIATEGPLGWSALRVARQLDLPVCADFRTNFQAYSRFYGAGWLRRPIMAYLRRFHNGCHSTMVPTDTLRTQLSREGFGALSVVARGVDTELFSPARRDRALRASWNASDDDVVVLHVGRLAAEKNLSVLATAFRGLQEVCPRVRLVVVGDGPARQALQSQCRAAVFAGFRTGDALAAHYASSDIFLFPSLTETYGNVTPEAMASGLAVVAFDDAAAGQLITHGQSGLLVPKGRAEDFPAAAIQLAHDQDLRKRLGQMARERVERLGWASVIRHVEDVYGLTTARASHRAFDHGLTEVGRI